MTGLVVGNMTIDDLVFPDGTTRMGVPGGDAIYSGIGASFWGVDVHLCSICGPDYPLETLSRQYSMSLQAIRRIDGPSMRNWGLYEEDGTRQFVLRDTGFTWSDYSPRAYDLPSGLIGKVTTHIAVLPWDHQLELAKALRKAGAPAITLDPDYNYMRAKTPEEISQLIQNVDVFLPSRQEAVSLFPEKQPESLLERFVNEFPSLKAVVIKLGEAGSIGFDRTTGCGFRVPACPVNAVDPTGAGDAFCGGVLAGLAMGKSLVEGVLFGTVSASFVVEQFGTLGLGQVSRHRLMERLESLRSQVSFI